MAENWYPNPVDNKSPFHYAWNKLMDWVRRNQLISSDDILVNQTTHGTSLKIRKRIAYGGTATTPPPVQVVIYDTTGGTAYSGGTIAFVQSQFSLNGVTVLPGTYGLISSQSTPVNPTGNQIPQIPVPSSGTVYWIPIAAGLVVANTCASGTSTQVYINSTGMI